MLINYHSSILDRFFWGNRCHFSAVNALILIGLILIAVPDAIHQSFVPGRSGLLIDIGLDLVGIFFGLEIVKIFWTFNIFQEK
ncbi:MAG: VanZ family protein [Desulfobacteraceae bacterium]|nr:MAG: VanZ family protein [Desulfobacteraceae bacterium]